MSLEVDIGRLSTEGDGVGTLPSGKVVFVPGALPGERVAIETEQERARFARGRLVRVISPSGQRTQPPCPVYEACGGCTLQHVRYDESLSLKRDLVISALGHIGGVGGVPVRPVLSAGEPYGYRTKAVMPVGGRQGALTLGFYSRGSHRLVPVGHCLVEHPRLAEALEAVRAVGSELGWTPYDEQGGHGALRQVMGRVSQSEGQVMLVLVHAEPLRGLKTAAGELRRRLPHLACLFRSPHSAPGNRVVGTRFERVWGEEGIVERIGDMPFLISPGAFFQVNPRAAEVLYEVAREKAGARPGDTVADFFCGTGSLGLFAGRGAWRLIGVESVPQAIDDARENARRLGATGAEFHVLVAEEGARMMKREGIRPDVVLLDPPRKGAKEAIADLASLGARRIVYVSCAPPTLARDLKELLGLGYRLVDLQPVDLFPQTAHVECVATLDAVVSGDAPGQ